MDGLVRRGRNPGGIRLDRRFEPERVEEEVWVKVYERIRPLVGREWTGSAAKRRTLPVRVATGRKGA